MIDKDKPWDRGDKITARRLGIQAEMARSNEVVPPPGSTFTRGRFGTQVILPQAEADNAIGVITTTVTARTGTSPNFVWGVGEALILKPNTAGTGSATTGITVPVYNTLAVSLAASATPVQLKRIMGKLFVDVKDCP